MAEEGSGYGSVHDQPTPEDLGLRSRPTIQDTPLGKVRRCADISKIEIAFLIISNIAIATAVVFTVIRLTEIGPSDGDFTFCIVLLINSAFCFYYIHHGIFRERPHEMTVFLFSVIIISIYIVANYITGKQTDIKLARMIGLLTIGVVAVGLGTKIALEYFFSKSLIFRTVGANATLQSICQRVFLFQGLLKLDLQLELTVLVFVMNGGTLQISEIVILAVGGPISLGWFLLGSYVPRFERKLLVYIFWSLSWAEPAYIGYRIYKAAEDLQDKSTDVAVVALSAVTIAAAAIAVVVRLGLISTSIAVYRAFGKGFKEKVFPGS